MAPEIVGRREYLGHKADIWALGILLFVMLAGLFPFKGVNDRDLYAKIRRGMFHIPDCVPSNAKALIKQLIVVDPDRRLTIASVLSDPWLTVDNPMTIAKQPMKVANYNFTSPIRKVDSVDINIVSEMTKMGYS
jgi:MAP/microtubule affinity-regulating kinase